MQWYGTSYHTLCYAWQPLVCRLLWLIYTANYLFFRLSFLSELPLAPCSTRTCWVCPPPCCTSLQESQTLLYCHGDQEWQWMESIAWGSQELQLWKHCFPVQGVFGELPWSIWAYRQWWITCSSRIRFLLAYVINTTHYKHPHITELLLKVCECQHILFPLCSELLQTAHQGTAILSRFMTPLYNLCAFNRTSWQYKYLLILAEKWAFKVSELFLHVGPLMKWNMANLTPAEGFL